LIATQRASSGEDRRPPLFETASMPSPKIAANVSSATRQSDSSRSPTPKATSAKTASRSDLPPSSASAATATPEPATDAATPIEQTNPDGDLRSSQARLNAIDRISNFANDLFTAPPAAGEIDSWSVNQQDMDQQDYRSNDADITKWFGDGGTLRAEEAQLDDGEVVDRWYNDDGSVEQVMHQYDKNNSYSVYRYPSGEIEATRIVRDGNEIFTRYDRDGRQIQRTYTPATND
jgi:hypothetical protein